MANIGDAPIKIIYILNGDNSSSVIGIVNPEMPNIDPLEVNKTIASLIVPGDNSSSGEGSIEDGSEPYSSHPVKSIDCWCKP